MNVTEILELVVQESEFVNYKIIEQISSGIYLGRSMSSGKNVAIKVEPANVRNQRLKYEYKLYQVLKGGPGIPQINCFSTTGRYNAMVFELLGRNLEELFNLCNRKFSVKTVVMLALQIIPCVEFVHSKKFIHRDITPNNILIGIEQNRRFVYLIDFSSGKRFVDKNTQQHISFRQNKIPTGTARFTSVHDHMGVELSRRDDLEAVGYILLYFLRGSLPWQSLRAVNKVQHYEKVLELKLSIPIETLCQDFPSEISTYLIYCRSLEFDQSPDYFYLCGIFEELFSKHKYQLDYCYDWVELEEARRKQSAATSTVELSCLSRRSAVKAEKPPETTVEDDESNKTKIGKIVGKRQRQKDSSQSTKSKKPKVLFQPKERCQEKELSDDEEEDSSSKKMVRPMPRRSSIRIRETNERRESLVKSADVCNRYGLKPVSISYVQSEFRHISNLAQFMNEVHHIIIKQNPNIQVTVLHQLMAAMWREFLASKPCREVASKRIGVSSKVGAARVNSPMIERPFMTTTIFVLPEAVLQQQERERRVLRMNSLPGDVISMLLQRAVVEESLSRIFARDSVSKEVQFTTDRLGTVCDRWRTEMQNTYFQKRVVEELESRNCASITLSVERIIQLEMTGFRPSNLVVTNQKIYGFHLPENFHTSRGMVRCTFVTFEFVESNGLRMENSRQLLLRWFPLKIVSEADTCLLVAASDFWIYRMNIQDMRFTPIKFCPQLTFFGKVDEARYVTLQTLADGSAQICLYDEAFVQLRLIKLPPLSPKEPYVFVGCFSDGNFLVGNKTKSSYIKLSVVDRSGQVVSAAKQIELNFAYGLLEFGFGMYDTVLVPSANRAEIKVYDRFLNLAFQVPTSDIYSFVICCENNRVLLANFSSLTLLKVNFNPTHFFLGVRRDP